MYMFFKIEKYQTKTLCLIFQVLKMQTICIEYIFDIDTQTVCLKQQILFYLNSSRRNEIIR